MEKLLAWLAEDPIRILTVVGGSGGVFYWLERLADRPRLRVKILRETTTPSNPRVQFEARNVGSSPMSLEPIVILVGYTPQGRRLAVQYTVGPESPLSLPPQVVQNITASAPPDPDAHIGFLWYRRYTFAATRGRPRHAYLRKVNGRRLLALQFLVEGVLFRMAWTRGILLRLVADT